MFTKKVWPIFGLALLIRLVLAATTLHSDLTSAFILSSKYILLGSHWFDFYKFNGSLFGGAVFNYPPLAYLVPNLFYAPFFPIVASTANNLISTFPASSIYLPLIVYKLPMIVADLATAFFITKLFVKHNNKNLAWLLWLFNPVAIYVSSVLGQIDVFIALLFVVALVKIKSNHPLQAAALLGLSCLFKPVALYLIPLIALHYYKSSILTAIKSLFIGFGVYALGVAPYLRLPEFRYFALFATQNLKSVYAGISIASGYQIPYFFILLALVAILLLNKRLTLSLALGLGALSSLVLTHFHPQWFVWITPWLIIYSANKRDLSLYSFSVFSWLLIVLSFDASLHLGAFLALHSLSWSLGQQFFFQQLVLLGRSWFVAVFFFLLFPATHEAKV